MRNGFSGSGRCIRAWLSVLALFIGIVLSGAGHAQAWSADRAERGRAAHEQLLRQFGGAVEQPLLAAYVQAIGDRLAEAAGHGDKPWRVTVLDSPKVNAFATDGGFVYVTRGLLALANSEAELAAVIGHEIAHITANHLTARTERGNRAGIGVLLGTILGGVLDGKEGLKTGIQMSSRIASGYVAQFSQQQEFDADERGIRTLALAGYDPLAQARFLEALSNRHRWEEESAGRRYRANRVSIFASHPATGDRIRRATLVANRLTNRTDVADAPEGQIRQAAYYAMIDGLLYGDSPEEGYVRGNRFIHAEMRFAYEVPDGFRLSNSSARVTAKGPNGATLTLDPGGRGRGDLAGYIEHAWYPNLKAREAVGALRNLREVTINGLPAARAETSVGRGNERRVVQLAVIEHNDRLHRLTAITQQRDLGGTAALDRAIASFLPLPAHAATAIRPDRIEVYRVAPGDSVESLVAAMPAAPNRRGEFLSLNGLPRNARLRTGQTVKLIVR